MKLPYSTAKRKIKKCGGKTAVFHFLLLKLWRGAINQKCSRKTQGPNCTLVKKIYAEFLQSVLQINVVTKLSNSNNIL